MSERAIRTSERTEPPRDIDDVLTSTRTVRRRLDLSRPVDRAVVEECLELALQAPNGQNQQRWRWVLVDDPEVKGRLSEIYAAAMDGYSSRPREPRPSSAGTTPRPPAPPSPPRPPAPSNAGDQRMVEGILWLREHLHEVPVLVVPCVAGRTDDADLFTQSSRWGSVLPAVWSFMLALRSRGLGSAWTTLHVTREDEVAELLGIPRQRYMQVGLFPVAHTVGLDFKPAVRRPLHEVAGWNTFPSD